MSPSRELRTCFITLILLMSSLSILTMTLDVKAEPVTYTTLYFHDVAIEDYNLTDYLYLYSLGDIDFEDLLNISNEMDIFSALFGGLSLYRTMDQSPPVKTNDSEAPPTLKTLVKMYRNDEFETLDMEEFIASFFGLFQGVYVYNGDKTLPIEGDISFNLYFSLPRSYIWNSDIVNVSFMVIPEPTDELLEELLLEGLLGGGLEPKFTKKETVEIKRKAFSPFKNVLQSEITISDVDVNLEPGDIILVSIDINAEKKLILDRIDFNASKFAEKLQRLGEFFENIGFLSDFGEKLINVSVLINASSDYIDVEEFIDQMSSSFIYDSVKHPSSVTLPVTVSGEDENVKTYYLHDGNQMDETPPTKDDPSKVDLKESAEWEGPTLNRSKILKEATASLYIDHQDLRRILNILRGKIKVIAELLSDDTSLASSEKEFDRTMLLDLLRKPDEPITFTFSDINKEVAYDNGLSLVVSVSNDTKLGLLRFHRNARLLYDSIEYSSSLTVKFDETDHIKIIDIVKEPSDEKIIPGGSVEYTFNVTSDLDDYIEIDTEDFSKEEQAKWHIDIPEPFSISEDGKEAVNIVVTSTDADFGSYEDVLDVVFAVTGKTGKATLEAEVEISEDAVEYDIIVIAPEGMEIKHGTNDTYTFKIKNNNTGFWPDSYTIDVSSEHGWDISHDEQTEELEVGEKAEVEVTLFVPEDTNVSSDLLTFTVTSDESGKSVPVNVTTTIIGPNILEKIYGFFESLAADFGLDDVLGSAAPAALVFILLIIIFLIIIVFVYFLKRKFVNLVCFERIMEIPPGGEARFEITLQNPTKKTLNYELSSQENPMSPKWDTSLDPIKVVVEPRQSKTVVLVVKPTDLVRPDDWMEVKVAVNTVGKQKLEKITTMTLIKDAKPELSINGVFHWPKTFKDGDIVETSFKLENKGNVSADNVTVVLYVNGKEKNKVEDLTIPSGGYADIEMPWIAVKGKNEVNIVVR